MQNKGLFSSDSLDRKILALSLGCLLLCALPLGSPTVYRLLFESSSQESNQAVVGSISLAQNDIRQRHADSFSWDKSEMNQKIRVGDSLFTGKGSQSEVSLHDGSKVKLGENSLVKFQRSGEFEIPNFSFGHFQVAVSGKSQFMVNGEIVKVEGKGASLEISVTGGVPSFRLLKGTASVHDKNGFIALHSKPNLKPAVLVKKLPLADDIFTALSFAPTLNYTEKIFDVYEKQTDEMQKDEKHADHWRRLETPRQILEIPAHVQWRRQGDPVPVYGQLAKDPEFLNSTDSFTASALDTGAEFKSVARGLNFFRLSDDAKTWTSPRAFEVIAKPLESFPLELKFEQTYYILEESVNLVGQISSPLSEFILEVSDSEIFPAATTAVSHIKGKDVHFSFSEARQLYARARGINADSQITGYSPVSRIFVEKPLLPAVPHLVDSEIRAFTGDEVHLRWAQIANAKSYHFEMLDKAGRKIGLQTTHQDSVKFHAQDPGEYLLKLQSVDAFGRKSKEAAFTKLTVSARPKPVLAQAEVIPRAPAEVATTTSAKISTDFSEYLNREFKASQLSVEGSGFTMYSQDQAAQKKSNPAALTLGLRWLGWIQDNGFEASFKTKAVDISTASDSQVAPLQLEARYHYRVPLSFSPFSKLGESQVSWLAGLESYRNSGSKLFSPGYDLIKTGLSFDFPLSYRWGTGGDLLYGQGLDSSRKYEFSGYLSYFIEKQLSLGAGYRVHLFEAGSLATTPSVLPYREGYGEGYTVLKWHY